MGIYKEPDFSIRTGILIFGALFVLLYLPWLTPARELFRQEGLYAVEIQEFSFLRPVATAHHVALTNGSPLYPAICAMIQRTTALPVECVMRGVSVFMLLAGAVLCYIAASPRSKRAGLVAAGFYAGTLVALEKGVEGNPVTLNAFLLLLAQLLFFRFSIRKLDWNRAWIAASIPVALLFLSGGLRALVFFVFPLIFMRRPLTVSSRLHCSGFAIGAVILAAVVLLWRLPYEIGPAPLTATYLNWQDFTLRDFLNNLWEFPLMLPLRLLPWSLIAWMPFCVALQDIDPMPIYSRYLRTLILPTFVLLWVLPDDDPREIFYLLGPLSILTGTTYELGMRRFGIRLRRWLWCAVLLGAAVPLAILTVTFVPAALLTPFFSLENTLEFREAPFFLPVALGAILGAVILLIIIYAGRRTLGVWLILICCIGSIGIFNSAVLAPYRAQEQEKRKFGAFIADTMRGHAPGRFFKSDIVDLYGALYYSGMEVFQVRNLKAEPFPDNDGVVYLLGTKFPADHKRSWTNLFPPDFTYSGKPLSLWKGVLRPAFREDEEEAAESDAF